jgi:hypothetical protein
LVAITLVTLFSAVQHGNAQAGGTKPELNMYRFNGSPGGSPAPVVAGDLVGTLRWKSLTAIGSIRTGASIESTAKQVSPGFTRANLIFRTTTAATAPFEPIPRMIITETGRVGIDEMDPQYNLHVKGNTHTMGNFYGRIHFDKNQTTNAAYALTVNGLSGNAASVNGNARVDGLLSLNNTAPNDALAVRCCGTMRKSMQIWVWDQRPRLQIGWMCRVRLTSAVKHGLTANCWWAVLFCRYKAIMNCT